jgi:curved DNA-binding protein CbpA
VQNDKIISLKGEKDEAGNRIDFYSILNLEPKATASEITRAYRKASLSLHPDKNPGKDAAAL